MGDPESRLRVSGCVMVLTFLSDSRRHGEGGGPTLNIQQWWYGTS